VPYFNNLATIPPTSCDARLVLVRMDVPHRSGLSKMRLRHYEGATKKSIQSRSNVAIRLIASRMLSTELAYENRI